MSSLGHVTDGRPSPRWSLQGQTALVTGGTKGIGRGVVEEFLGLGASVYTCARSEADLQMNLKQWKEAGYPVEGSVCDVSLHESRIQLMQRVSNHFGGMLNILINNVGRPVYGPSEALTEEQFQISMDTNLKSAFHLSQLAHPLLKVSGRGSILFNSSIAAFEPIAFAPNSLYCMAKAALNQLTRALANEWAQDGIRVNCIAPGIIYSDRTHQVLDDEKMRKSIVKEIPVGRTGEPCDVAAAMAFYCMPCASFCTGDILLVDGGHSVRGVLKEHIPINIQ